MANTLFDKIWDAHVVQKVEDGPTQLYIDRLYCHEVTSPQAFAGLRARGVKVFRPDHVYCMPDHNTPTHDQDKPIEDPVSKTQVDTLAKNAKDFGLAHFGMMDKRNGIIHVVGPERGLTLPGMTIVCGDSHTSTHGAMGAVAFGIGTSEVEMVLASQCILQSRPKTMRITIDGELGKGVTAKDMALYMMSKMTTSGATGYFVEYAGSAVRNLSMEGRLTLCNLSIEMGARGGMVAPDEVTFEYIKGREHAPKGADWDKAVSHWKTLKSDDDAVFDKEVRFDAADIQPMITYGTNPGMGMGITEHIPVDDKSASFKKSLDYMGFQPGEYLLGKKIDYVFLGACTNGRIEDFRAFTSLVRGKKKADHVIAWLVPGSWMVDAQIREEGLHKILEEAGFSIIPARFLKATTREEKFFGDNLFRDWRYNPDGSLNKDFVLNNPTYGGQILVAGKNFGSGSSREHAAWAIAGYGFRVVVSSFFADIHKNNELNNFVLPVVVSEGFLKELFDSIHADPKIEVEVNLPEQTITNKATGKSEHFEINAYKKHCLMNGLDDIDFLLTNKDKIEAWEKASK